MTKNSEAAWLFQDSMGMWPCEAVIEGMSVCLYASSYAGLDDGPCGLGMIFASMCILAYGALVRIAGGRCCLLLVACCS